MARNARFNYGLWQSRPFNFSDKPKAIDTHVSYMLCRTQSMFKYNGLPYTIPQRMLELYLQTNGNVCIYKHNGNLYAFVGGFGGTPNVYYMPTQYIIANPALGLTTTATVGVNCVVIPNDSLYIGLIPMFERYATSLVENELSLNLASINSRIISLISAGDDRTAKSAEKYLDDIEQGKRGVIAENAFLEGVKSQPYGNTANSNAMTNLIEYEQYLKASWYNEIGLNANYNMKRESISAGETGLNDDMLLPLVDDMLRCRKEGITRVNEMFGTQISVDFASSWEDNVQEIEQSHKEGGVNVDAEKGE